MTRHDVELVKYLLDNQITLIPVSEENQINYGCNGLNLGNGSILLFLFLLSLLSPIHCTIP